MSMRTAAPRLAVAGLSVRALAQAAQCDGFEVHALDLFGDADTLAASASWQAVGEAAQMAICPERLLAALRAIAAQGEVLGWLAGSGFEGQPALLSAAAAVLPLLGCSAEATAAVRDPQRFFSALDAYGMPHPAVAFRRPVDLNGWLSKDARACGGWHVRGARPDDADPPPPGRYWQRREPGQPMSMTLLAAGRGQGQRAVVLGINAQTVRSVLGHPHVFAGVVGPVNLPGRLPTALLGMAERLVAHFDLTGLCGLDFLWHGDQIALLEINPRPPASAALYGLGGGLVNAHLAACLTGRLPQGADLAALRGGLPTGLRHVFTHQPLALTDAHLTRLAAHPDVHDRPAHPGPLAAGEPLCTLTARGDDVPAVVAALDRAATQLLNELETLA